MAEYLPDHGGRWLAAMREEALLVLPAERVDDVRALWPHLDGDAAAHVIDRLAGSGITAAPSFALVVRERPSGTARALVRGDLSVTLGDVEVSGAGVSTWQERAVDGHPHVHVAIAGANAGRRWPIVEGVVAASVVDWPSTTREPESASVERPAAREVRSSGTSAADAAAETIAPDERTIVPEDTVVGVSRTERPRIERPVFDRAPAAAEPPAAPAAPAAPADERAPAVVPVIVPPDFGSSPPSRPEPATPRPVAVAPTPTTAAPTALGDHDGLTVARSDLGRLREERRDPAGRDEPTGDPATRDAPASSPASPPPALRMPDGSIEPIVGELVLGRAPAIGRVTGTGIPRRVVIGAGDPDISRTHLRVAVEGGTVVVTDLESRNGTQVVAPGQPPLRLRPSEATPVLPDTVIDLGGGWSIQVVVR
ncbi:FHA domain-containing protein [Agromyces sp. SYSU T00266]|uniref:FHA domain-containing protein n=1 Tax=Agromyces zhanjiangensis TaxID=3158562 RepID=UPI0033959F77